MPGFQAGEAPGVLSLAAADLDGDGDPDVVGAIRAANSVKWYDNLTPAKPRAATEAWASYP